MFLGVYLRPTNFTISPSEEQVKYSVDAAAEKLYRELASISGVGFSICYQAVEQHVADRLGKTLSYTIPLARALGDDEYPRQQEIDRILGRIPKVAMKYWKKVLLEAADTNGQCCRKCDF